MNHLTTMIAEDLAPFADLGTNPPRVSETDGGVVARLTRNGEELTLTFKADGRVIEQCDTREAIHASFRALLASASFADLRRWADSQSKLLRPRVDEETIPIVGTVAGSTLSGDAGFLDDYLFQIAQSDPRPRTIIALIDGPAGIGKTSVIRALAYRRAVSFITKQRPLILHVESRGRMLQNITDLMAFSLQSLRLNVTYDQIPLLVRNGLVTLAVDGFDELGDPSGYDLAWAQVNDLVISSRGSGSLIFAGRETFITKDRILTRLSAVDTMIDRLEAFNLRGLSPADAADWLLDKGWAQASLEMEVAQPLFEAGSYALRPFFLSELAKPGVEERVVAGEIDDLLPFLVAAMIKREAGKFGRDVEIATTPEERESFISELMQEVARDLAENQTKSIQAETLAWLAEAVSEEVVPAGLTGILKNRAGVLAFLTDDERPGFKRFVHDHVYNFFLAKVTVRVVQNNELTKFIRRNIFGSDFLESFSDVFRREDQTEVDIFISNLEAMMGSAGSYDRARGNLAALAMSACSVSSPSRTVIISDVSVDEAYISETVAQMSLRSAVVSQLTARGADFRNIEFLGDCSIATLIADAGTVPSLTIPTPAILVLPEETIYDPRDIQDWLHRQAMSFDTNPQFSISELLQQYEPFALLARVARYKPFWLKDGEEKAARKILDDPYWELLKELLIKHDLLVERQDVPASGRPSPFYHVKNRTALMNLTDPSPSLLPFLSELFWASVQIEEQGLS